MEIAPNVMLPSRRSVDFGPNMGNVGEELSITNAYLVTSRYDDLRVRERASTMKTKIIPKSYVPYIPVVFQGAND